LSAASCPRIERAGWSIRTTAPPEMRERLITATLQAVARSRGLPHRRSRRATTWILRLKGSAPGASAVTYVKLFDAPDGILARIKRQFRGSLSGHVERITKALRDAGIHAPQVVIAATEMNDHREFIGTERIEGHMLAVKFRRRGALDLRTKRVMLKALGHEIAKMHRAGFIHGDMTPFNVFVTSDDPPQFSFIDHERTRPTPWLLAGRHRMRNFVQLGRFKFAGLTRTDKVRVFVAYAGVMGINRRRAMRRAARMVNARISRDTARASASAPPIGQAVEGGAR